MKEFLGSGAAGCVWWRLFVIPFMKKYSKEEAINSIENPHDQVMRDTTWLQRRMARLPNLEDDGKSKAHPSNPQTSTQAAGDPSDGKQIVLETHSALDGKCFKGVLSEGQVVKTLPASIDSAQLLETGPGRHAADIKKRLTSTDSWCCLPPSSSSRISCIESSSKCIETFGSISIVVGI